MPTALPSVLEKIAPVDQSLADQAQARLDNLTKPQGSLGRLEEICRRLAVIFGSPDLRPPKPAAVVFAADHGVARAGVSPFPREVTAQMVLNFVAGGAGINVLARQVGAVVRVVDVGVDYDFPQTEGLTIAKVARGTANLLQEPAMSREQAGQAIEVGIQVARELMDAGHDLLIPGEMGIGNTTPSACLTAAFTGRDPGAVTGRGAGLDDAGLARKQEMVAKALERHRPDPADPLGVLAALGGLEIAALCGYMLAAASRRVPVVLDGFIATAAALTAARLAPAAGGYFMAGHRSSEHGHRALLEALDQRPLLDLEMRLGEGTGAALAVTLIKAAVAIYNQMATFESAGVSGRGG